MKRVTNNTFKNSLYRAQMKNKRLYFQTFAFLMAKPVVLVQFVLPLEINPANK